MTSRTVLEHETLTQTNVGPAAESRPACGVGCQLARLNPADPGVTTAVHEVYEC